MRCVSPAAIDEIAELLELHPAEVHDTMIVLRLLPRAGQSAGQDARVGLPQHFVHAARRRGAAGRTVRAAATCKPGETTADGRVTLEFAECLGACEGAPCMLVNDECHMNLTEESATGVD